MTQETGYRISKNNNMYNVFLGNETISKGCLTLQDALKSIWINDGKDPCSKFFLSDDIVMKSRDLK
jgi:hypothetical protein